MEGKINVFGDADVMFAVYKDGSYADEIPGKSDGYSFQKADCTNGATAKWDYSEWGVKVTSLNKTKTKCSLYFVKGESEQSGENKMEELLAKETTNSETLGTIVKDDFNNIRYIGKSPNNWVTFNGEQWRIIGLMDNIETSTGKKEKLLKIIRSDSLDKYSWDRSSYNVNNGYGVNEWSQADLMYALKKYGGESTGLSSDKCGDSACPNWLALNPTAQNMIETVVWNTGTTPGTETAWKEGNFTIVQYMWERSKHTGKQCTKDNSYCSDIVDRTTEWTGKVGLMYPSDYGYATDGGGSEAQRDECIGGKILYTDWPAKCYLNDWLMPSNQMWTITPAPDSSHADCVFFVSSSGYVGCDNGVNYTYAIRPVVYLKSSVKITGGDGTSGNPYTLTIS